jgi:DNA damage-inducible protein 1
MHLTIAAWDDRVFAIEIDGAETVETLKAILEVESALPAAQQQLLHHGNLLKSGQRLTAAGVSDGDMIMLVPPMAPQGANQGGQQQQQQQRNPFTELNADGSAKAPVAFIQQIKGNQQLMGQLQHQNPSLAAAIRNEDVEALQASTWLPSGYACWCMDWPKSCGALLTYLPYCMET